MVPIKKYNLGWVPYGIAAAPSPYLLGYRQEPCVSIQNVFNMGILLCTSYYTQ